MVKMKKIYTDVKKFKVKRSKWFRGQGSDDSFLLNNEGQMCCLGFYSAACGIKKSYLKNEEAPGEINSDIQNQWQTFLLNDSDIDTEEQYKIDSWACTQLMKINDDENMSDTEREEKLTKLFANDGIEVKFED